MPVELETRPLRAPAALVGEALCGFEEALRKLRARLSSARELEAAVFVDTSDWISLLTHKLVPHMAGEGCLIATVTGGTNTGKSTVFNLLLGSVISPAIPTAAATARPVIAANDKRARQCLEGMLMPEFESRRLLRAADATARDAAPNTLYVAHVETLPDRLVLLDTPDVDSIERSHWSVAEHIRAAGDVLIAVLTPEKYKDDRVVQFFRHGLASGRLVVPVMNKANPAEEFDVARRQLAEFRELVEYDGPAFLVPHDFRISENLDQPLKSVDGDVTLLEYLESLDVPVIKERVYRATIAHFAECSGNFLNRAESIADVLRSVDREFVGRSGNMAAEYDPAPGAAVGGLFHEYVQARRSRAIRWIGAGSKVVARGLTAAGRALAGAIRRRADLQPKAERESEAELHAAHTRAIERISRDLAKGYIESARNLREPAGTLVDAPVHRLDVDRAVRLVVADTLRSDNISEEFREHAQRMLDTWWNDHKGKRRVLEALDGILALTPAAIAVPISMHTAGVGVDVAIAVGGPVVEQFFARVIEYQFGDAMFDFLSPWRTEQQRALREALLRHVTAPALAELRRFTDVFDGETMKALHAWHKHLQQA